jgi:hypothetical protein
MQEPGYINFGYHVMSSKFIDPSLTVIGVAGSIAISVGSVLAETGVFPRFGSKVVNVM